jgi:phosphatidate cytidylyltransferase
VADPDPTPAPKRIRTRARPEPTQTVSTGNDTLVRVITGLGIGAVAIVCFVLGTAWLALLSTVVVLACAFEVFDVLRRAGYVPATLLGLVATVSIMGGTYWKGERALPLVLALTTITTFLWYLFGVVRARPTVNVAATLMAFGWVGLLGSFATLLLQSAPRHHGVGLLYGPVLATVACDVGSFVAGQLIGTHPLMPEVSPNKTWEGALGGLTGSLLAAVLLVQFIHPWNLKHAALLGLMVAVVAPLGDLSESLIKRDLGLKDMGSILPGHGGILDRMDAMLFVLPATYYLCQYLNIR